jgi:hypothetical protein
MKDIAYHEGIKCSSYEEMFGCLIKLALTTSTFPQELIKHSHTEEGFEDIYARSITAEHARNDAEQNETRKSTENN